MKYVKLIARADTWFKEGTEVYSYDCTSNNKFRITLKEWNDWKSSHIICVRGIRISQSQNELVPINEEYFDGESCLQDEFEVTETDERI